MNTKIVLNQSFLGGMMASIASSPAASTDLPCENLVNGMRHKLCRITPAGGTLIITATLAAATSINAVGIGGLKVSSSATCKCIVKNGAGVSVYDSGTVNIFTHSAQHDIIWFARTRFWFPLSIVSAKTIEITINDSSDVDISHLVFGLDNAPSINPDWGAAFNWVDTFVQQRTAGGSLLSNPAFGHRRVQMTWPNLPDSDWNNIAALIQNQGQAVMVSVKPGEATRREGDMQMIGRLVSADGISLAGYGLNTVASCVFEEI